MHRIEDIKEYRPDVSQKEIDFLLNDIDFEYLNESKSLSLSEYPLPIESLDNFSIEHDSLELRSEFEHEIEHLVERAVNNITTEYEKLVRDSSIDEVRNVDTIQPIEKLMIQVEITAKELINHSRSEDLSQSNDMENENKKGMSI